MSRKKELCLLFLVHWTLHTYVTAPAPPQFMDTLPSFSDPNGTALSNVVVDHNSGDVFVGGRNVLYHFSADLELKQTVRTGPVEDAKGCPIPPNPCATERIPTNNDNRILKLVDFLGSPPKLLLCGSVYKKLCQVRPTDNLYEVHWVYPHNNTDLGSEIDRALFDRGHDGQWTLFTAHGMKWPTQSTESYVAVSSKVLVKINDGYHFRYPLQNDSASSYLFLHGPWKEVMGDGFLHDGYVYFVVNILHYQQPSVTKLLRFCTSDTTLQSYAELPLQCNVTGKSFYNRGIFEKDTLAAHYGESPSSSIDKSLYVSFRVRTPKMEFLRYHEGTAICVFQMTSIIEAFNKTPRDCNRESFGERCDKEEKKDNGSVCGTIDTPYLVSQPLLANSSALFRYISLQSIITVKQYNKIIVIGGGNDGSVIKVNLSTGEIASKNHIWDENTAFYKFRYLSKNVFDKPFVFDHESEHIYMLTGNKIIKYPVANCGVYETCDICLTQGKNDPLQCGWCAGQCTHLEECTDSGLFSRYTCNPSIYEVSPQYATIQGGHIINITGDNFGSYVDNEHTSVSIAGIPCKMSLWNNTGVLCILGSALKERLGPIQLNVTSNPIISSPSGHNYTIIGSAIGLQNFTYFVGPRIYGIRPHKGPTSGGTHVTIFGENLDYDRDKERVFSVNKRRCTLIGFNTDVASCITGNVSSSEYPESISIHVNNITTFIVKNPPSGFNSTGLSQSFEYTPDPEIHLMEPGATTVSGLKNVTATGIFLHSVQFPTLVVEVSRGLEIVEECWSDPESRGTVMTCRTPSLLDRPGVSIPTWTQPLLTHVSFIMDGVRELKDFTIHQEDLSRLMYYPDPDFREVLTDGGDILYIKGNHLNLINSVDNFQIKLGDNYICIIRTVSMENITCDIPPNLMLDSTVSETNISVEVVIGYSSHLLGYIMIKGPGDVETILNPTLSPVWWILLFLILVCVILIGFVCFKYWKKKDVQPIEQVNLGYSDGVVNGYDPMTPEAEGSSDTPVILQSYASTARDESGGNQIMDVYIVNSEITALLEDKNLIIPKSCLIIGENVGAGQFGCVFEGLLKRPEQTEIIKVAIKTLREHSWSNPQTVESFLKEALIMKDFDHPNVLSLLGVCFEGSGPSIVLPFMENGDLCSFIRDEAKVLLITNLLKFAVDIACGMAYLADKKFLHRDLAARNCVLDCSLGVKVADFGLSRDVYVDDYYRCENRNARLPYRWMAPESLETQKYTTKTDVWSYGVLLWELTTRGSVPYANVGNWDVLEYVKLGHRLNQPEHCPKLLYMVMLACWNQESKMRPDFCLLHECISHIRQIIMDRKQKKVPSKSVPAQHTVYYNCRELYLKMDGHVLNKEILENSGAVQNEYLDMNKQPSV